MSKTKYTIIDKSEDVVGFLVINEAVPTFQHTTAVSLLDSGPIANGVLFITVLGGTATAIIAGGLPGWIGSTVGVAVASSLTGILVWRSAGSGQAEPSPGIIKVEHYDQAGRLRGFDDIKDESITDDDLRVVAARMKENDFKWSKAATGGRGGIGGPKHDRITQEFLRLDYLRPLPNGANGFKLTLKGRGVLRSV